MPRVFNEEEERILKPYFTNLDRPVYAFTSRVPEEVVAVLFSKYSRSRLSLRENFLSLVKNPDSGFEAILRSASGADEGFDSALRKARSFFQRILVGYGDDSVGELGIAHCAIEDCSNIATKRIEDARLTSPLEKSTRYVVYDKDMYFKEPVLMKSEFAEEYRHVNELLMSAYSENVQPAIEHVKRQCPIEDFEMFDGKRFSEIEDGKEKERARKAYEASVRARALDVLRYYLPVSTLTNVGVTANGRAFEYLISKLLSDELEEVRAIGRMMHEEISKVIPSLVKRASPSRFIVETRKSMFDAAGRVLKTGFFDAYYRQKQLEFSARFMSKRDSENDSEVKLVDYDRDAELKIASAALYGFSNISLADIRKKLKSKSLLRKVLSEYIDKRSNRREKPMRAAETAFYVFDILSDYGAYRDLQRHRMLTQVCQTLTVANGYETPPEIVEFGLEKNFRDCMKKAEDLYLKISKKYPHEAQYVVPFAYRVRYLFSINLRECFHFIELRSTPQGHPSYRRVAQKMYREIEKVHPFLAEKMKFVFMDNRDSLGRLKSELRTQKKLSEFEKADSALQGGGPK